MSEWVEEVTAAQQRGNSRLILTLIYDDYLAQCLLSFSY